MITDVRHQINSSQALLFDMDGTLFDTEPLHAEALAQALCAFEKQFTAAELHHRFYGKTDTSIFLELFPDRYKDEYQKFQETKNEILTNIFNTLTPEQKIQYSAPGIKKFLQYLRRCGKKLALVSSSEQEIVDITLKAFGVNLFFDLTIGRSGTHLNKPNPSPYLRAMRHFKVVTTSTIIFEDSPSGLRAAYATGCPVIRSLCFDRGEISEHELKKIFTNGALLASIDQFNLLLPETDKHNFKELDE